MKKGFTLIELLVVIAIIGILSSVVLASLNSARSKGSDAAIKSNIDNSRAQAELYYDASGNSGYAPSGQAWAQDVGVCTDTVNGIAKMITGAKNAGAATVTCFASSTAYAVSATLKAGGTFCIDSLGNGTTTAGTTISSTVVKCL